jgi:hypothetical protein
MSLLGAMFLMGLFGGRASAQVNSGADPRVDATNFVTSAVSMFNNSTMRFQALRLALEEMHPLAATNLDTATLYANLQSLLHYQKFLEAYRQQNQLMLRKLDDSVGLLEARLGDTTRWKLIDRFYQSLKHQTSIFVGYSIKCSNYIMAARSTLIFLQTNDFDLAGGAVHIHGTTDAKDQYAALVNKMSAAQTAMQEAFQMTVDETKRSNEVVLSVVDQLGK